MLHCHCELQGHLGHQAFGFLALLVEKGKGGDFPGGPVVKNPPYNAGDTGSILDQGTNIPHVPGQLSPHVPQLLSSRLNYSPHAANYRAHMLWSLRATTREEKTSSHD